MAKKVKVADLVKHFKMEVICGEEGLKRPITVSDLYRPGLEIAGYFNYHPHERVQILGKTELTFAETLPEAALLDRMTRLTASPDTPCIVVSRGLPVPDQLIRMGELNKLPILRSPLPTTTLIGQTTNFLESKLALSTTIHGVLVDIYGIGLLITGSSGIGKSETALELVKRGHRLVADDSVEIRQTAENVLIGNPPELIKHLLEIRGVGIINVMTLFGAGAVRSNTKINMVVRLETWQQEKQYDRLGLDEETIKIIETDIPLLTIPVRPGRNLAVIIEVGAMNYRLKRMGLNAALQFSNKLTESIAEGNTDDDDME